MERILSLLILISGRWKGLGNLRKSIQFNHVIRSVQFNEESDTFTVVAEDLNEEKVLPGETFDYVIVGSGHFSVPNMPSFSGIESFPGRILHSHEVRDATHFRHMRSLLIGAKNSGNDLALQCKKFGARSVVCSWRTQPMGFKWPNGIFEKPLVSMFEGM